MNKNVLLAAFVCSVSSAVFAGSATYKALDENGDGFISSEEAAAIPTLVEHWSEVDVNDDGKIDAVEFASFESLSTQPDSTQSAPSETSKDAD